MICALCGKEIKQNSIEHVFPRAIYKWSEEYLPKEKFDLLRGIIESDDNLVDAHAKCNRYKGDTFFDIDRLFITVEKKNKLSVVHDRIKDDIHKYVSLKEGIIKKQKGKCYCCGKKLYKTKSLRRIDITLNRTRFNGCVVCEKCCSYDDFTHVEGKVRDLFSLWLRKKHRVDAVKQALTDRSYRIVNPELTDSDTNYSLKEYGKSVFDFIVHTIEQNCNKPFNSYSRLFTIEKMVNIIAKRYNILKYLSYDKNNTIYSNDYNFEPNVKQKVSHISDAVYALLGVIYLKTRDLEPISILIKRWITLVDPETDESE